MPFKDCGAIRTTLLHCTVLLKMNIMVDPRVFRGSVVAAQREQQRQIREQIKVQQAEERFRTELLRSKLTLAMGRECSNVSDSRVVARRSQMGSQPRELARLAGPIGRKHIDVSIPADLRPVPKLPLINVSASAKARKSSTIAVRRDSGRESARLSGLRNVRFEPLLPSKKGLEDGSGISLTTVIPTLPPRRSAPPFLPSISRDPTVSNDATPSKIASLIRRREHRPIRRPATIFKQFTDPPPSARGPMAYTEVAIQTEEQFEEMFGLLISEMVSGAIADARRSLLKEDEFKRLNEKNKELMDSIAEQNKKNAALGKKVEQHMEEQRKSEEEKERALKQLELMESRRIASEVIEEVVDKSMEELLSQSLIRPFHAIRSIGTDTRQMEMDFRHRNRAIAQVENDFFPYVYGRAERIVVHKVADSYLRDALFARNNRLRDESTQKLNDQIRQYSRISRSNQPGTTAKTYETSPKLNHHSVPE